MPKVGDRVIVEGTKIGGARREGTLIGTVGPLINVRWSDGTVSLFKPGAGSVSFESGNGAGKKAAPAKKAGPAKTPAAKKTAAKKPAAKKPAAKVKAPATKKPAAKKPAPKKATKKR